ncbi:MAG TPA: CHAD domain-containing protein [Chloroflexi bacterium]|nr:CHAD domain-containing protein [Chloroflexota bacterium]
MPDTTAEPIEIEAKFSVADASILARLAKQSTALPGYGFGSVSRQEVVDAYLDTPDHRLLRTGYQLRARAIDGAWRATFKTRDVGSDVGIYRRLEIEEPLAENAIPCVVSDLPEAIVDALAGIVAKTAPLVMICVLEQTRQVRTVTSTTRGRRRTESAALATLSLDEIRIRQQLEGPILARAYEIEVELAPGVDAAELQVLADRFIGEFGLTPSKESKLERALAILSRHPIDSPESWQGVRPAMHMGEACRLIWQEQFMKLLLNEAGVRYSDDPEYVHDARVAIRRARAAARIYQSYFKPKVIRNHLRHLRKTARLLGAVRDLDVAIDKLERYQKKTRRKNQADLQATLNRWSTRRAAAFAALIEWLDSEKYAAFVTDFLTFCRTPGAGIVEMQPEPGEAVTPFQVRHVAPTMLIANFERVRAYEVWFDQPDAVPVETLHRLRIECKYLRYNLEFMAGLLGPETAAIIDLLRKLQDDLGDLNDAVVSRQLLATEAASDAATVSRYERDQARLIDKLSSQLRGDFANFVAEANRLRLCAAIAKI